MSDTTETAYYMNIIDRDGKFERTLGRIVKAKVGGGQVYTGAQLHEAAGSGEALQLDVVSVFNELYDEPMTYDMGSAARALKAGGYRLGISKGRYSGDKRFPQTERHPQDQRPNLVDVIVSAFGVIGDVDALVLWGRTNSTCALLDCGASVQKPDRPPSLARGRAKLAAGTQPTG